MATAVAFQPFDDVSMYVKGIDLIDDSEWIAYDIHNLFVSLIDEQVNGGLLTDDEAAALFGPDREDFDFMIEYTDEIGSFNIDHVGEFVTWGSREANEMIDGLAAAVEFLESVHGDIADEFIIEFGLENDPIKAMRVAEEQFYGRYDDREDFALSFIEECCVGIDIPSLIYNNLDLEGVLDDLSCDFAVFDGSGWTSVYRW